MKAIPLSVDSRDNPVEVPLYIFDRVFGDLFKFGTVGEDVVQLVVIFLGVDEDISSCFVSTSRDAMIPRGDVRRSAWRNSAEDLRL